VNAVAKLPLVAGLAARAAAGGTLPRSLLRSTGSRTSAEQAALYSAFMASPEHNGAVLTMMANWNLPSLLRDLPRLTTPVTLLMAADDPWVSAAEVVRIAGAIPRRETVTVPRGGHLLHEEQPEVAVWVILDAARRAGLGPTARVRATP
jgi:magnesium chelatase accessory protein